MRRAPIALCLVTGACVSALPGGTLGDPATGATGGTTGSAGAPVTGGGASTGGPVGPATGGSAVTGAGGAGDPNAPLVLDAGKPGNIAVDATNVYWVNRRLPPFTLTKAPITGGPPVALAQVSAFYTWVGTDGESVYWSDGANSTTATHIFKMPSAGGLPTWIAMGTDGINRFVVRPDG